MVIILVNYFFSKTSENEINNEVNANLVESSSNDVELNKNIDKSINCETSMLLNFLLSCFINNF